MLHAWPLLFSSGLAILRQNDASSPLVNKRTMVRATRRNKTLVHSRLGFLLLPLSCCRAFLAVPASWLPHSESAAVLGATERGGPSHRPPPLQAGHFNDFMETVHSGGSHRAWLSALVRRPPMVQEIPSQLGFSYRVSSVGCRLCVTRLASFENPRFVKDEASSLQGPLGSLCACARVARVTRGR